MNITATIPVLPSANIERDVHWYTTNFGFKTIFADNMYAVLHLNNTYLHLQWHADTGDDPLLGGSVVRFVVPDIELIMEQLSTKEVATHMNIMRNTAWHTHEIGIFDLNKNALFFVQWL